MMTPEEQLLLICMRQEFTAEQRRQVAALGAASSMRWERVLTIAEQHNVAPLVYQNLQQCDLQQLAIPAPVLDRFARLTLRNIALMSGVAQKIRELLTFSREQGIEIMLIKGAALNLLVYDQPWYTVQDVDLVIKTPRQALGARQLAAVVQFFAHLPGFEYDYWTHHDVDMNGTLPVDFDQIWRDAQRVDCRGEPVWVMGPEDLLIAACINSGRKRFLRLKSLLDIAEIVSRCTIDWPRLLARARVYQCQTIVYTALLAAQQTVGTAVPAAKLSALQPPAPRRSLIHQLLQRTHLTDLHTGPTLLGRTLAWSLLLPYATLSVGQIGRRLGYVWRTR